ncbi:MAG: serine/threonine-protein phosphatase [Candidatus Cloacimonetes bacterium]|nr:serine/threonine-protein phosphatase [Candidatus Cloacimonadota bacterium]
MILNLYYHALSRKGGKPGVNEDYLALPEAVEQTPAGGMISKEANPLFVLCDGLGGHQAGEIASRFCCSIMKDKFNKLASEPDTQSLKEIISQVNRELNQLGNSESEYYKMATTLAALVITPERAIICNVGDSRIYLFSSQELQQLSEDHSVVWNYYRQHLISKDDILKHPEKHLVTQAMGLSSQVEVFTREINLPEHFVFLLCSDGMSDYVRDSEIATLIENATCLLPLSENLWDRAQSQGSYDDISVILISDYLKY